MFELAARYVFMKLEVAEEGYIHALNVYSSWGNDWADPANQEQARLAAKYITLYERCFPYTSYKWRDPFPVDID